MAWGSRVLGLVGLVGGEGGQRESEDQDGEGEGFHRSGSFAVHFIVCSEAGIRFSVETRSCPPIPSGPSLRLPEGCLTQYNLANPKHQGRRFGQATPWSAQKFEEGRKP